MPRCQGIRQITHLTFLCLQGRCPTGSMTLRTVPEMSFLNKLTRMLFVIGIIAIYLTVLWMGLTEESRRSLTIVKSSASNKDFVTINVR
jgi:hypothetical protein